MQLESHLAQPPDYPQPNFSNNAIVLATPDLFAPPLCSHRGDRFSTSAPNTSSTSTPHSSRQTTKLSSFLTESETLLPALPSKTSRLPDELYDLHERPSPLLQRQQRQHPLSHSSRSQASSSSGSSRILRRTPRLEPRRVTSNLPSIAAAPGPRSPTGRITKPLTPVSLGLSESQGSSASRQDPRSSVYWPRRTTQISKHTADAILYALEAIRGDPEGRLGSPQITPSANQPAQWRVHPFTPNLAEENASMSDLVGGAVGNGRTQNGGSRAAGPIPSAGTDRVQTPTQVMAQRRVREARRKEESERQQREQAEAQRRAQEESIEQDSGNAAAGVESGGDRTSQRRSRDRTSNPSAQPSADRRAGDRGSAGSNKGNAPSAQQPAVYAPTSGRTERVSTGPRENAAEGGIISQPRTRQRGATVSNGQPQPVNNRSNQAPRAVSAAVGRSSVENQPPQTRQGSKATGFSQPRIDRPGTGPSAENQGTQEQQPRSNASSFPHAFERWEQLSSHWEGLTSFWIRRLEQNKEDLDREPLNQQMARQVTDLSAAGANLFHAVVELQRLRASSERKFQRWFFETRAEQERARENQGKLEEQLRSEREARTEAATSSARFDNEIKAAYAARSLADVQVKEMRRELAISKDEARRAWEELGRREQEERDRTASLRNGEPTLVGGVQVLPMAQGVSRQGSTNRPSTRDGPAPVAASTRPIGSPTGGDAGYTTYDPARSETDTDPFMEGGRGNPSQGTHRDSDLPPVPSTQSYQQTSNASAAAVQAARAATHSGPPQSNSTTRTTTTTVSGPTYLRYGPDGPVGPRQPGSSFYQHEGSSLHPDERNPRVSEGDDRSYVPSLDETASDEDYDLDENGEVRRDADGRPIISPRRLGSEDSDEYDVREQLERERMYGRSYGTGPDVQYGSGPTSGAAADYTGSGYGAGWEAMPRHHHPTRLSDVLEEDERSRTSPSRASQTSRGIR